MNFVALSLFCDRFLLVNARFSILWMSQWLFLIQIERLITIHSRSKRQNMRSSNTFTRKQRNMEIDEHRLCSCLFHFDGFDGWIPPGTEDDDWINSEKTFKNRVPPTGEKIVSSSWNYKIVSFPALT